MKQGTNGAHAPAAIPSEVPVLPSSAVGRPEIVAALKERVLETGVESASYCRGVDWSGFVADPSAFLANYTVEVLGHNVTLHVESLMTLIFEALLMPDEILWVRDDVPRRAWDKRAWAPGLEHLTLPGLNALYRRFVPTDDTLAHTGARNWVRLADRMRYVWPMFRGRQDGPNNNCGPFSHAQVDQIWAGRGPKESEICLPYNVTACCGR